jgi:hypothetical protein
MLKWLTGKKTYIGAAGLAIAAIAGFWFGAIDATQLGEALSVGFAIVGLGHKYDRLIADVVAALEAAKQKSEATATVSGAAVSASSSSAAVSTSADAPMGKALEH